MRGVLKRKFAEVDMNPCCSSSSSSSPPSSPASSECESDGEGGGPAYRRDFTPHSPPSPGSSPVQSIVKRPKLESAQSNVRFDLVTVFSFPRCQSFISVPSHGGATLGMTRRHSALRRYTVAEHAAEQKSRRRERLRERRREEKLEALRHKLISSGAIDRGEAGTLTVDHVPDDVHISDSELEGGAFVQPYSSGQRRALLLAAGVKRVDKEEKRQLHALRLSREECGCDCQGYCEPETCACSLAGIKCQVDRFNFPCGCTRDGCGNTQGHVQFDSRRVQTHYIHTAMRLDMERQMQSETRGRADAAVTAAALPEDLAEERQDRAEDKSCPFGFTLEEDGLPLTLPTSPSFSFLSERSAVEEESSCSSDMTESSCSSSDCDGGGSPTGGQNLAEVNGGLSRALSISEDSNYATRGQLRQAEQRGVGDSAAYSTTTDSTGPLSAEAFNDNKNRNSVTEYLDENANQARDFFDSDSLEDYPNTPSPTLDYSSSRYMDPSLSSDSDLEFFDSDYPCVPLHSSFKGHRQPEGFQQLQLFSSAHLPQYESSTYLLESLIGLTEPGAEQVYDNQLL